MVSRAYWSINSDYPSFIYAHKSKKILGVRGVLEESSLIYQ